MWRGGWRLRGVGGGSGGLWVRYGRGEERDQRELRRVHDVGRVCGHEGRKEVSDLIPRELGFVLPVRELGLQECDLVPVCAQGWVLNKCVLNMVDKV